MAGRKPFDTKLRDRARELKLGGRTAEEVRKLLAAEGHKVSARWVSLVYAEQAAPPSPKAPASPAPEAPPAEESRELVRCDRAILDELQAELEGARVKAAAKWVGMLAAARAVVDDEAAGDGELDIVGLLRRQVAVLEAMAAKTLAGETPNIDGHTKLLRVLNASAALVAKLTPPPRRDPEENPDMVAAAGRAREKLHDYVGRALRRRAGVGA